MKNTEEFIKSKLEADELRDDLLKRVDPKDQDVVWEYHARMTNLLELAPRVFAESLNRLGC